MCPLYYVDVLVLTVIGLLLPLHTSLPFDVHQTELNYRVDNAVAEA